MDDLNEQVPAAEAAIPAEAIPNSAAEPKPSIADGGQAPATPDEPKGPTAAEKRERAIAEISRKWDALKSRDDGESLYTDGIPASDAQSDEPLADAGSKGVATNDAEPPEDFDQRRELADYYGLSVEQLAGFATAQDAERALEELDSLAFSGRLQQPPTIPEVAPQGDGKTELTPQQARDLGLDLSEWSEDEPLRKNLSTLEKAFLEQQDSLQKAIERLNKSDFERQQEIAQYRLSTFHSTLDSLDANLYGKNGEVSRQQAINREYLQSQVAKAAAALEFQGIPVPRDVVTFVKRVHRNTFGGSTNDQHAAAPKQPAKPRPQLGAPGRSQPRTRHPSGTMADFKGDPRENPKVIDLYETLVEKSANGY